MESNMHGRMSLGSIINVRNMTTNKAKYMLLRQIIIKNTPSLSSLSYSLCQSSSPPFASHHCSQSQVSCPPQLSWLRLSSWQILSSSSLPGSLHFLGNRELDLVTEVVVARGGSAEFVVHVHGQNAYALVQENLVATSTAGNGGRGGR